MSTTVDNRVVQMRFDNKQFEAGVKTSLGTLTKFKHSLEFGKEQQNMDELQRKADSFTMRSLSKSVDYIASKFTVFGQLSQRVFDHVVDSAEAAGKKIINALAIDPVKTGFSEYETQINAVQTILSNTRKDGTSLNEVNAALDELNTYADKTIYNFTEMTRNIGTFTAAGVDLKTSTSAIKGIANLAAVSGSNAQQASTAMYQLSQAMASGTVKLMDWNSVVNAGMGGQVFQDALIETARVHKINVEEMIKRDGSFRETLQYGWLTTEILTETLSKFTGDLTEKQLQSMGYTEKEIENIIALGNDANNAATKVKTLTQLWDTLQEAAQSGWTSTWELIVGDFYEAQELFTLISDSVGEAIGAMSDARNDALTSGLGGGWEQFLNKGIANEMEYQAEIIKVATANGVENIDEMIKKEGSFSRTLKSGWLTSDTMVQSLDNLISRYKDLSDEELKNNGYTREQVDEMIALKESIDNGSLSVDEFTKKMTADSGRDNLFEAVKNSIAAIGTVIKPINEAFHEVFGTLNPESIYSFTKSVRDFTESLILNENEMVELKNAVKPVLIVVDNLITLAKAGLKIGAHIVKTVAPIGGVILQIAGHIGALTASMSDFASFEEAVEFATNGIIKAIDTLAGGVKYASDLIVGTVKTLTGIDISNFNEVQEVFSGLAESIKAFIDNIINNVPGAKSLMDVLSNAFDGLRNAAEHGVGAANEQMQKFFDFTSKLKDAASDFAKNLASYLSPIVDEIKQMFSGVTITDIIGSGVLVGIFKAVKKFTNKASDISDSISDVLDKAGDSLEAFTKKLQSQTLRNIAVSVMVLAAALVMLSQVNPENLGAAFASMSGLLIETVGVLALLSKLKFDKDMTKIAIVMILIATSISVLANALTKCKAFGAFDESWPGLVALVGLVGGLLVVVRMLSKVDPKNEVGKQMIKMSVSLILFGFAIGRLGKAISSFGDIDPTAIFKSLITVAIVLAEVGHFAKMLDNTNLKATKSAIVETAFSLIVLFGALYLIGGMDKTVLIQGMATAGAAIVAFIAMVGTLKAIKGDLAGTSKSILAMALAMNMLIVPIYAFGKMNLLTLAQGLIGFSVALFAITKSLSMLKSGNNSLQGVALGVMSMAIALNLLAIPIVILGALPFGVVLTGLIGLAGAIAVLTASAALLSPLSEGLAKVAKSVLMFGIASAAIGVGILGIATALGILATIGAGAIAAVLASFAALLSGIKVMIPLIQDTLTAIGLMIINITKDLAGPLCEAAIILIDKLLVVLDEHAPSITEHLVGVISGIIEGLVASAPRFATAFIKLINTVFAAVKNSGEVSIPALMLSLFSMVGAVKLVASIGKDFKNAVKGAAALGIVMTTVGVILGLLSYFPADQMLTISNALTPLLMSLAGTTFILSLVPVKAAITAVEGLAIMTAGLTGILAVLGGINQIPGVGWLVDEGGELLGKIGGAIHKFVTSLFGEKQEEEHTLFDSLPAAGKNLTDFITSCQGFAEGLKGIDEAVATGAANLGKAIVSITASTVISGILSFGRLEKKLVKFGVGLNRMAPHLRSFFDTMSGVDKSSMLTSSLALKYLGEMAASIPNSGGLASLVTGDASIRKFSKELADSAPNFKRYASEMADVDTSVLYESTKAIASIVSTSADIPNDGGLVSLITGDNNIGDFGEALASFGPNFKVYADSVSDIKPEVVEASTSMVKSLSEMAKLAPNSGGLSALIFGDNDLSDFGESLSSFGRAFLDFYYSIENIKATNMSDVMKQINKLISTVKNITDADIDHIGSFASGLKKLANDGINDFLIAFENSYERAANAISTFVANINTAFEESTVLEDASNWGIRIAEGVLSGFATKKEAMEMMAASTSRSIASVINDEMSVSPVITPVVDMTDVYKKKRIIDGLFGSGGINVSSASSRASNMFTTANIVPSNSKSSAKGGSTVVFNQYNNSPKALSANDIYRNTKNQLAQAKKGVYGT